MSDSRRCAGEQQQALDITVGAGRCFFDKKSPAAGVAQVCDGPFDMSLLHRWNGWLGEIGHCAGAPTWALWCGRASASPAAAGAPAGPQPPRPAPPAAASARSCCPAGGACRRCRRLQWIHITCMLPCVAPDARSLHTLVRARTDVVCCCEAMSRGQGTGCIESRQDPSAHAVQRSAAFRTERMAPPVSSRGPRAALANALAMAAPLSDDLKGPALSAGAAAAPEAARTAVPMLGVRLWPRGAINAGRGACRKLLVSPKRQLTLPSGAFCELSALICIE